MDAVNTTIGHHVDLEIQSAKIVLKLAILLRFAGVQVTVNRKFCLIGLINLQQIRTGLTILKTSQFFSLRVLNKISLMLEYSKQMSEVLLTQELVLPVFHNPFSSPHSQEKPDNMSQYC